MDSLRARGVPLTALVVVLVLVSACYSVPRKAADWSREDAHSSGTAVAFDQDATYLASAGMDGQVRLWVLPDGGAGPRWQAHDGPVTGLVSAGAEHWLSAGWDGTLALWSAPGVLQQRRTTLDPITALAGDIPSGRLVTGHAGGLVRIWSLAGLKPLEQRQLHRGKVRALALQAGGAVLASSGSDGQVFLWRQGEQPHPLEPPPTDAWSLAFSPDRRYLVGGGWFDLFRWSLGEGGSLDVLPTEHHGIIASMDFRADGALATISRQTDSAVDVLDVRDGRVLERLQKHALCGSFIRFSPDSRYLATTSDDASVRFWDLRAFHRPPSFGAGPPGAGNGARGW